MTNLAPGTPTPWPTLLRNATLVALGGALGVLLRTVMSVQVLRFPDFMQDPSRAMVSTFLANLVGAFVLAFLAASVLVRPDRQDTWLIAGVGLCGGFTSYSALAADAVRSLAAGSSLWVELGAATLVLGLLVSAAGWWLGAALNRYRLRPRPRVQPGRRHRRGPDGGAR